MSKAMSNAISKTMSWSAPRFEEIATSAEIGGYQDDLDRERRHDDDGVRRTDPGVRVAAPTERGEAE